MLFRLCEIFDFGTASKIGGKSSRRDERDGSVRYQGAVATSEDAEKDVTVEGSIDSHLVGVGLRENEDAEEVLGSHNSDHAGRRSGRLNRDEKEKADVVGIERAAIMVDACSFG